ncbi:Alpha-L-rhamnosidase [Fusarium sp. LHS14.1]|nr:Alpha-L-rhamnosidase [Fusarium sp. LHS14.1]
MAVFISKVTFEHHRDALGIGEPQPRISWRFGGNVVDWEQSAYDVQTRRGVLTTYHIDSNESLLVPWSESPLASRKSAEVRVRAHGQPGQASTSWSAWTTVEADLLDEESWGGAVLVAASWKIEHNKPKKPVYFHKSFDLNSRDLHTARLYITALDLYETHINGKRVGDHVLAPGLQSYHHRHVYNTFDVSGLLQDGRNVIQVTVAEGWYSGRLFSFDPSVERNHCGNNIGLLSLLHVTLADGFIIRIPTDSSWSATTGPLIDSQIYDGEVYDSRLEHTLTESADGGNNSATVVELPRIKGALMSPDAPPVRRIEERKPVRIWTSPKGKLLADFGQNLAGWVRIKVSGQSSEQVSISHAEVIENGEIATLPLRSTKAQDTFILNGQDDQVLEPRFTYHGFRYIQVDGWPEKDPFNETSATARGWHRDVWAGMQRDGSINVPHYVPITAPDRPVEGNWPSVPTAIWGDVAVAGPWHAWRSYGDLGMLEEQYKQAQAWLDIGVDREPSGLWNKQGYQWGDWLDPLAPESDTGAATTDKHFVADAYLIGMTDLVTKMSRSLNRMDQVRKYEEQAIKLRQAFTDTWLKDGEPRDRTQTAYSLMLYFDLFVDEHDRNKAANTLREIIAKNEYLVGTGFAGTWTLGHSLRKVGATEYFYKMLLQTRVPSWLYQVVQGATTTWERWDSLLPDGSVNGCVMTSFNHYAFGSVADWIHGTIGGLRQGSPGWKEIVVAPVPGGNVTSAETRYVSGYGTIDAQWWIEDGEKAVERKGFHLKVTIPTNSKARVVIPGGGEAFEIGSGFYQFHDPQYSLSKSEQS